MSQYERIIATCTIVLAICGAITAFYNRRRDRAKLAVFVETNPVPQKNSNISELVIVRVENIGKGVVFYHPPLLLCPDGETFPHLSLWQKEVRLSLDERLFDEHYFQKSQIKIWLERSTSNYTINDLRGVVIDMSGKQWYSKSSSIFQWLQFLPYRIKRKLKRHKEYE